MSNSIPPCLMDKKLAEARHALLNLTGRGTQVVHSALVAAAGRIKHLEQRLGETETMRDRIAIQLLPGILERGSRSRNFSYDGALERAFKIADLFMLAREQGSAEAPGETPSPDFSENAKLTPEEEGARLFKSGCPFSSIFGDVDQRFANDMPAMQRVAEGYYAAEKRTRA